MTTHSPLKRWLALGTTAAVLGAAVAVTAWFGQTPDTKDEARAAPSPASAKHDVPMFGGTASRNMVNTFETNIPTEWEVAWDEQKGEKVLNKSKSKHVKWAVKLGSRSYGGPLVVDGKVYVGTNNDSPRSPKVKGDKGVLMCFEEATGKFLWQIVHDKLPSGPVNDWPQQGLCSTPLIEGNFLYYVSNRCEVHCYDMSSPGEPKDVWKYDMMKELKVFPHNMAVCSPVIAGDVLLIVTANGVDEDHSNIPSPDAPSFIGMNKKTGALLWKNAAPGKNIMHGQWSNAVYAEVQGKGQAIFPGGDGWLYAFEPVTGNPLWRFDANPKDSKYDLGGKGTRSDFIGTPVVIGDRCYIGTGQDPEHYTGVAHLWCIDITKTGDVSPDLVTKPKPLETKKNPNSAVVWHFGGPTTEAERHKGERDFVFGRTMSTVAVHDGLLYAGELDGFLHCLDARTGKPYWKQDLKAALWGSPYWVDGKVYIGTEDGDLWIFAHGKEKKQIAKIEMEQPIRSTPIAVNGALYVMTESYLYVLANK